MPAVDAWLLSVLLSVSLVSTFLAWRRVSARARTLTTRFRFYALRDRCVSLVAAGVVREHDELFRFFYGLCNSLAGDARRVDLRTFVQNLARAVLAGEDPEARATELAEAMKKRPPEFQTLVSDFYRAAQFSLIDSNTLVQVSSCCEHIPGLTRAGRNLLLGLMAWHALPVVVRESLRAKRDIIRAYDLAGSVNAALQAS